MRERVIRDKGVRPDGLDQLFFGDEASGVLQQVVQDVEALRPYIDLLISGAQTSTREIEGKARELEHPAHER
jgi:hypothetical protein